MQQLTLDQATILIRFEAKVEHNPETECWIWTGGRQQTGYGRFWDGNRFIQASRFAYEIYIGPIPEGLEIDHLCRNRSCVNPIHLEPVTRRENCLRGIGPTAKNAAKSHCIRGHPLVPNVYRRDGSRQCYICARLKQRLRRQTKEYRARQRIYDRARYWKAKQQ